MLERKKLNRLPASSVPCEMDDCCAMVSTKKVGKRTATTALYIAGYPLGSYCEDHAKVMQAAWITDEVLLSQQPLAA